MPKKVQSKIPLYLQTTLVVWVKSVSVVSLLVLGKAISFVWKIFLAKLGPESLGLVQLILTYTILGSNLSLLGWQTTLIRFISVAKQKKNLQIIPGYFHFVLKVSLSISLLFAICGTLFPGLIAKVFQIDKLGSFPYQLVVWLIPLFTLHELYSSYFSGTQQIFWQGFLKYFIQPCLRLFFLFLFIYIIPTGPQGLGLHLVLAALLSVVSFSFFFQLPLVPKKVSIPTEKLTEFISYSFPISGSFLIYSLYFAIETTALAHYTNLTIVGLFTSLILFVDLIDLAFLPILNTFFTYLSAFHGKKSFGLAYTLINSGLLLVIGALSSLIIYVAKDMLIYYLLGPEFAIVTQYLAIFLIIKIFHSSLVLPLRHFLDYTGYVKQTLWAILSTFFIKLVCVAIFVPMYGIYGVALAQGLTELWHLGFCLFLLWFYFRPQLQTRHFYSVLKDTQHFLLKKISQRYMGW